MSRIVHFEFHADNPERAEKFYSDTFGWEFTKWQGPQEYWLIKTGPDSEPGIDGGMARRREQSLNTCNTIRVKSVDDTIEAIKKNGGEIVLPKQPIPGVGYLAFFKDTEGNILGIMHPNMAAK